MAPLHIDKPSPCVSRHNAEWRFYGLGGNEGVLNDEASKVEADREVVFDIAARLIVHAQQTEAKLSRDDAVARAKKHIGLESDVDHDERPALRAQGTGRFPELFGLKPAPGQIEAIKKELRESC